MKPERLRLATHLHFTMDMDRDFAGCPFSDEEGAQIAAEQLVHSEANWLEFVAIMSAAGDPLPEGFHWNDHTDLIS